MHHARYGTARNPAPPEVQRLGFVEFTTDQPDLMEGVLRCLGFSAVGTHHNRPATLYRQGSIHILVSADSAGYARQFRNTHGASVCAIALHVDDAPVALEYAESAGAQRYRKNLGNELNVNIPALVGPAHTLVYLVDGFAEDVFHQLEFKPASNDDTITGDCGLTSIEQITLQVDSEYAQDCIQFYQHALCLRDAKTSIPAWGNPAEPTRCLVTSDGSACIGFEIRESQSKPSLGAVRTLQFATRDIQASVDRLRKQGIGFAPPVGTTADLTTGCAMPSNLDPGIIQCVSVASEGAQENLLRAQTLPILGGVSIQLVQRTAPEDGPSA